MFLSDFFLSATDYDHLTSQHELMPRVNLALAFSSFPFWNTVIAFALIMDISSAISGSHLYIHFFLAWRVFREDL